VKVSSLINSLSTNLDIFLHYTLIRLSRDQTKTNPRNLYLVLLPVRHYTINSCFQYLSYVYNRTSFFQRSRHHANTQPSGCATRLSNRISCVNVEFNTVRCTTVYLWRKLSQVRTSRCRSTIDGTTLLYA